MGVCLGTDVALPVTFTNTGGSGITIQSAAIVGGNGSDFQIASPLGGRLAPGVALEALVDFFPTSIGAAAPATLEVTAEDGSKVDVALSGQGLPLTYPSCSPL
jgi:hypothetical protein